MVNVPRVHCHSALKHYEMYHWNCGSGSGNSVFNTTYNFNGGFFGGSFGSGLWSGIGMGLGAGLMSLFGFGGGGWGGFGNMFGGFGGGMGFGFPSFSNWWGGSSNIGNTTTTGGSTTTVGGSVTNNNTIYKSNKNKDAGKLQKNDNKVNKFISKYESDKAKGKLDSDDAKKKALLKATDLYNSLTHPKKDDVETDDDNATIKESKRKLALIFPELAERFKKDYNGEEPGKVNNNTAGAQQNENTQVGGAGAAKAQGVNPEADTDPFAGKTITQLVAALGEDDFDDLDPKDQPKFEKAFMTALGNMNESAPKDKIKEYIDELDGVQKDYGTEQLGKLETPFINKLNALKAKLTELDSSQAAKEEDKIHNLTDKEDIEKLTPEQLKEITDPVEAKTYLERLSALTPDKKAVKGTYRYIIIYLANVAKLPLKCAQNTKFIGDNNKSATIEGDISNITEPDDNGHFTYKIQAKSGAYYTMEAHPENQEIKLISINGSVKIQTNKGDVTLTQRDYTQENFTYKENSDSVYMTRNDQRAAVYRDNK